MTKETKTGTISELSIKAWNGKDTFKFKLEGNTYSGFGKPACKNGDEVEVGYTKNEKNGVTYLNVFPADIKVLKSSTTSGELIGESAKAKRRSEQLVNAVETYKLLEGKSDEEQVQILNKVKVIYNDFMRTIGEPNDTELQG